MLSSSGRAPDLEKWKFGGVSVYLCLPATYLHTHSRFFRLFIDRLLSAIESKKEKPNLAALMILDEMHVLGHMKMLETAAGLIAGYGVKIWSIWQDFAQLKSIYKERWETFLGNASIIQSFGLNDLTTLKYMSDRIGTSSIMEISQSEQSTEQAAQGFSGQSKSIKTSPLLTPEEVAYHFSRQSENQLLIYAGVQPIHIKRIPFKDAYFSNVRVKSE
jgi:type IV secretion system protein VirD4